MKFFGRRIIWITAAAGIGILLGLLLPLQFVAGIEAVVIVVLCICSCFKH